MIWDRWLTSVAIGFVAKSWSGLEIAHHAIFSRPRNLCISYSNVYRLVLRTERKGKQNSPSASLASEVINKNWNGMMKVMTTSWCISFEYMTIILVLERPLMMMKGKEAFPWHLGLLYICLQNEHLLVWGTLLTVKRLNWKLFNFKTSVWRFGPPCLGNFNGRSLLSREAILLDSYFLDETTSLQGGSLRKWGIIR